MQYMVRTPWAMLLGGYSVTYFFHYLDVVLLSRWSFEHRAPVSGLLRPISDYEAVHVKPAYNSEGSIWERLEFGLEITSSFRFVGTPYQVRGTPPIVKSTRKGFLRRTVGVIILSYVTLDFINSNNDPAIASMFLTAKNVPFFRRIDKVSVEEFVIRFLTVILSGVGLNCV